MDIKIVLTFLSELNFIFVISVLLYFSGPTGSMTPILLFWEMNTALAVLGGVGDVALFIIFHEQTQ